MHPLTEILAFSLKWDPQIHGLLVVLLAIVLLPGSVYLLLSTNLGSRVGFLVAIAGLFGWMTLMAIIWTVYGIGFTGNPPAWNVDQIIQGNLGTSTNPVLDDFPQGWRQIPVGDPNETAAAAAADPELAPPATSGKQGIFAASTDYIVVAAYDKGGGKYLPGWNNPPDVVGIFHHAHYFVVQVQRVLPQETVPGAPPPKPKADPTQPFISVVMSRDLGNVRQKPIEVAIFSGILFGVACYALHRRDKQAWAARGTALEPVGRE
ncbi:MAG: hypothetical protein JO148_09825 [Acidimicrobiia bacterium]|nr:hypothetical protein [Acidimicrobiia bacterium]